MASFCNSMLILYLIGSFISEAQSLTCSSQSFPKRSFAHCDDLPHLNAFLHWSYNPKNSSLSVAFLALPSHSGGWVAWGVNPIRTGMVGAQALIATLSGGTPSVRTFNISSYSLILPSPVLSFPVWDLAAEFSDGRFTIFATVKVPAKAKSLNQVWQVGPAVNQEFGVPVAHEFKSANLNAESELVFDKESGAGLAPLAHGSVSLAPAPAIVRVNETAFAASAPGPDKGGVAGIRSKNLGFIVGLFVFIRVIISF